MSERKPAMWQWRQYYSGKWGNWNPCWNTSSRSYNEEYWQDLAAKCPNTLQVRPLYADDEDA